MLDGATYEAYIDLLKLFHLLLMLVFKPLRIEIGQNQLISFDKFLFNLILLQSVIDLSC